MVLWALLGTKKLYGTETGCDERPILHRVWRDALGSANGSWSYSLPKSQSSAHLAWVHREGCLELWCLELRRGSAGERGRVSSRRDKLELYFRLSLLVP